MLVDKKDLRTGASLWEAYTVPVIQTHPFKRNEIADVVIIGAGISGAMIAEELSSAGFSVVMLDRRKLMHGSTMASTALLQYELDIPLQKLVEKIGFDKAVRAWRRSKLGLESLAGKIKNIDIDCGFTRCQTLYLSGNVLNSKQLHDEMAMRNRVGLQTGYRTRSDLKDIYSVHAKSALHTDNNITANPVQMTTGFLKAAIKNGIKIHAPVEATNIKQGKDNVLIETSAGYSIKAKYVVFATGYEIPEAVHTSRHKIQSTWAIATKLQPKKAGPNFAMIWEASDPYLYIRSTPDGRIICGGEDEEFSDEKKRDALIPKKTTILQKKLKKILPDIDCKAEYAWTGSFGSSQTGLPSIGPIPHMKRCFVAMAYGGNGITFSRVAAEIIHMMIMGQHDPDEDLFSLKSKRKTRL